MMANEMLMAEVEMGPDVGNPLASVEQQRQQKLSFTSTMRRRVESDSAVEKRVGHRRRSRKANAEAKRRCDLRLFREEGPATPDRAGAGAAIRKVRGRSR